MKKQNGIGEKDVLEKIKDYELNEKVRVQNHKDKDNQKNKDKCGNCKTEFDELNEVNSVQCEGNCGSWFHRRCAMLSEAESKLLS